FLRTLAEVASHLGETHIATFALGLSLLVVIWLLERFLPRLPAPLVAALIAIAAVYAFGLDAKGAAAVGPVPAGLPAPAVPSISTGDLLPLLLGAGGVVLVSFCNMITTARGFAEKNGYSINANQDMVALGLSDLASAFNRGFVVSGATSRTAVADS